MNSVWSSCFEVKISPKQNSPVVEDSYCFTIAPFQKAPVINFENVKVGCRKVKALTVINGTQSSIEVQLTKCPPQFTFSVLEFTIPASGKVELDIAWTPVESGSWHHVVKVLTNTILKFDLVIICSSKDVKVLPRKGIKLRPKSIAGQAQYLSNKNRCAKDTNSCFGNTLQDTKQISDSNIKSHMYSSQCRRATMVLNKNKFSCNKENEREKQFQNIANSKINNIDDIYDRRKLTFEKVSSFTSVCDNFELGSEDNDRKINNRKKWNLSGKKWEFQEKPIDEDVKAGKNLSSESDKFSDSLEDSKNFPNTDEINFNTSLQPVMELPSKQLRDMDESSDFLRLLESPVCKSKITETANKNFSFASEAQTNKLCNLTPNWLQTPECTKYLPGTDIKKHDMDESLDFLRHVQSPVCEKRKINETADKNFSFASEAQTNKLCNLTPKWLQTPECTKYLPGTDIEKYDGENFLNKFNIGDSPLQDTLHKQVTQDNKFDFSFSSSTPKYVKNGLDFTKIYNEKTASNFEKRSGEILMNVNINKFTITESEKMNHWEKIEMSNYDDDSLLETPIKMPVLCGGKTVTKKNHNANNFVTHWKLEDSDLNREIDTGNPQMKVEDDTFHSPVGRGIKVLQFSPPKRKTWKSSPKLCMGSQTRLKACTKRKSPRFKPKISVNSEVPVKNKIMTKQSSLKNSSSSASISKLKLSVRKKQSEVSIELHNPDQFIRNLMKPGLHSNPFLQSKVYCDLEWLELQEKDLIIWLNTLLSPPDELVTDKENHRADVTELWQQARTQRNVKLDKSLEQACLMYNSNNRLSTLRKASCALFRTDNLANVFCKLVTHIDKQLITLKEEKNFFQDIGLQHKMLELFLCYNPLWLRIGLETVYGKTVPVESNSDIVGLVSFIMHNFFEDRYLKQRYPNHNEYMKNMMKLALKKFLILVYFLDQAKAKKLIGLNPCLFTKNSYYKASRDILLSFSREFISGLGDIIKHLKNLGYVVSHEQTYIDEFDFSVQNLLDLRDGIRLCKVMEVVLNDGSILNKLRTPAISMLQKIHNVSIALSALESAGYTITGDISPKDIVNGHREKTLSLIWQIKYKLQEPKFVAAAKKLQKWWRSLLWNRRFNNLIALNRRLRAAVIIQNRFRANNKMRKERSKYIHFKESVIKIQRWYRTSRLMKTCRKQYIMVKSAVLKIQTWYRATILMHRQRAIFCRYKHSAILIQNWIRSIIQRRLLMKKQKENNAATLIQRKYLTWKQRNDFLSLKSAVLLLQRKFREIRKKKHQAEEMYRKKQEILAAMCIQKWYRRRKCEYLKKIKRVSAAILIQKKYRAYREMQVERKKFTSLRAAAIVIQRLVKDNRQKKMLREREILIIQQKVNAAVKIQATWRGYSVRKNQSKRLQQLSKNIKSLRENNKNCKTIRTIYTSALDSFLIKDHMEQAKAEIRIISNLTEMSRELCSDFTLGGHLCKIFSWLKSSNRSLPHQNVCLSGTKVLVNVARDPRNHFYVLQVENSIKIILQLMTKFVSLNSEIFCNCCKILLFLAEDHVITQVIKEIPDCERRLVSFHQQKDKKCKFERKKRVTPSNRNTYKEPLQAIEALLLKLNIAVPSKS